MVNSNGDIFQCQRAQKGSASFFTYTLTVGLPQDSILGPFAHLFPLCTLSLHNVIHGHGFHYLLHAEN